MDRAGENAASDLVTVMIQKALASLDLESCAQCGVCTSKCPAARKDEAFNPRHVMASVQMNRIDELIRERRIWHCNSCAYCRDGCPARLSPFEVLLCLKIRAVREGPDFGMGSELAKQLKTLEQKGIRVPLVMPIDELMSIPPANSVLVIGGGIAGIQAALDLANRGVIVHLVERSASIGGVMAQLDKTFPTMDCSICILAPKMMECYRHPRIILHSLSEVSKVRGSAGSFKVNILEHPRYVDATKCKGCGVCMEKCPIRVPNEFQAELDERTAIYIPFPQAVPLLAVIDSEHCLFLQKGLCKTCERVCPACAIDYNQKAIELQVNVSAIIVATGFTQFSPREIHEYGYKRFPNVITSLEFERLICASGPKGGRLQRLSDGESVDSIAFIQCVGSRTQRIAYPYCSSVCCMYATKEAILIREHYPDADVTIFYNDLMVYGKGFHEFVKTAQERWGVNYVRGRPGEIREVPSSNDLVVWFEDTEEGVLGKKEADLVVLCSAMVPRPANRDLAKALGIELDDFGFFKPKDPLSSPLETAVPGIYLCGCCRGPRDIPESVVEASAAAAMAVTHTRFSKPVEAT